jgi:general secretion pathway protein F
MKMAVFRYEAYTETGDFARGEIEAMTLENANDVLWARGLTPIETRVAGATASHGPWWRREIFASPGLKLAEAASFTRELAVLKQADIAIDDALRILAEQGTSPAICRLAGRLLADVLDGSTLSDALAAHAVSFKADYVSIVRAGEVSGDLGRVLSELAELLERRLEISGKVRSALVYPAVLIAVACASTATILAVLVPSVAPIFAESGRPVPAGLQVIIDIENNWIAVASGLAGLAAVLWLLGRALLARPDMREKLDGQKLKAPLLGGLASGRDTARFARTLGTLLRAGVPLLSSLATARGVITNQYMKSRLSEAADAVRDGESLNGALARFGCLPQLALRMIRVGEEAGKMDQMLMRVAVMFERQVQQKIDRLMSLLAPLLTVSIAGLIGALIFTVMSAILSINELASQ